MDSDIVPGDEPATERVSTGVLPPDIDVEALISAGYERFLPLDEGAVADYIPALAAASPSAFGVCVAGVRGRLFSIGDADQEFAIESISKLFVFALVCHSLGHEEARRKLGVDSTGLPFNSVMAIELNADRTMNPLVNAGCHGHHKPGAGQNGRCETREHRRRAVAIRRAAPGDGPGRLRI